MDIQDLQMEQDPFGRHQIDVFLLFLRSGASAQLPLPPQLHRNHGVTIPGVFVVFDHIVIFQSVLHRTLLPFLLPISALCLQNRFIILCGGFAVNKQGHKKDRRRIFRLPQQPCPVLIFPSLLSFRTWWRSPFAASPLPFIPGQNISRFLQIFQDLPDPFSCIRAT